LKSFREFEVFKKYLADFLLDFSPRKNSRSKAYRANVLMDEGFDEREEEEALEALAAEAESMKFQPPKR
jgi:hypothetical protein